MQRNSITRSRPSVPRKTTGSGRLSAPLKNRCSGVALETSLARDPHDAFPGLRRSWQERRWRTRNHPRDPQRRVRPLVLIRETPIPDAPCFPGAWGSGILSGHGSRRNARCEAFNSPRSWLITRSNCRESRAIRAASSYFSRIDSQSQAIHLRIIKPLAKRPPDPPESQAAARPPACGMTFSEIGKTVGPAAGEDLRRPVHPPQQLPASRHPQRNPRCAGPPSAARHPRRPTEYNFLEDASRL